MESSKRLLLQSLGLCLVLYYVDAGSNVRLVGNHRDSNEDMSAKLSQLKDKQVNLERQLQNRPSRMDKIRYEMELRSVKRNIEKLEDTLRVPYKDYIQSTAALRQEFEKEKAELRKRLEEAENMRVEAKTELTAQTEGTGDQTGYYEQKLEELTTHRNKIANEYAKLTDAFYREEQNMKIERDRFLAEQEELLQTLDEARKEHMQTLDEAKKEHMQTLDEEKKKHTQILDEAKKKHAQTLEVITATPAESYRLYSIPEQNEINKLRTDITAFNGLKDKKQLKEGLERTKKNLEELLDKLYKLGKFSSRASDDDLKNELIKLEKNTMVKREEQDNRRKDLVENIKQKDLASYSDEDLESLQKTNEEVTALINFQKEIDQRSAYLRGIWEVSNLLKECTNAIQDSGERSLANKVTDVIRVAWDNPLTKYFTKTNPSGSYSIIPFNIFSKKAITDGKNTPDTTK